jgi:hypothetical protein
MAAATLVNQALAALGLDNQAASEIYSQVNAIVEHLKGVHALSPINITVTGNISERLCDYGLRAVVTGPSPSTPSLASKASRPKNVFWQAVQEIFYLPHWDGAYSTTLPSLATIAWCLMHIAASWLYMRPLS